MSQTVVRGKQSHVRCNNCGRGQGLGTTIYLKLWLGVSKVMFAVIIVVEVKVLGPPYVSNCG